MDTRGVKQVMATLSRCLVMMDKTHTIVEIPMNTYKMVKKTHTINKTELEELHHLPFKI